jgi:hypothetical protein
MANAVAGARCTEATGAQESLTRPMRPNADAIGSRRTAVALPLITAVLVLVLVLPASASPLDWAREFGSPQVDRASSVVVRGSTFYAAGFQGQSPSGSIRNAEGVLRAYSSSGSALWERSFGTRRGDIATSMAENRSGLFVVGFTDGVFHGQTGHGGRDAFVQRYSPSGHLVWTRQLGTRAADGIEAVAAGPFAIYVAGWTYGTFPGQDPNRGNSDIFVRKFDLQGKTIWTRQIGTAGFDEGGGIDQSHRALYVAGYVGGVEGGALPGQSSLGGQDGFVLRMTTSGVSEWIRQFGSSKDDFATAVCAHGDYTYVVGGTAGSLDGQARSGPNDAFVQAWGPAGARIWQHQFGSVDRDEAEAVGVTRQKVVVGGWAFGRLRGAKGHGDSFLGTYTTAGMPKRAVQFGNESEDRSKPDGVQALIARRRRTIVAGGTWGPLLNQTSWGSEDAFIARLSHA